ncbi:MULTISPECIES: pyridoxamine 5'-phosphate oxidase [Idiomarina]|uniref:Pyridoxine/pyridoxamine 5'-phosphate oxidase n=1 Tax=Idiomarina baltica OS145 TaxID=314276 RepID=A0ABP2CVF0_9GAMM|nr:MULTISPECIES: pyridoxamine 5'-phosphate oxidase [Idiomarina]EAQ32902.1 Pyridoxamine phosphate oxidase [Idiomarina baltica OS145]MEC8924761.1 pyridoxamine 5'-phosphate oxidase [Pseudomonadota bacterium]|tara:strand:- start:1603 stop:2244 length:642 start_codon:yes stop_codon:yes gene_type:complete
MDLQSIRRDYNIGHLTESDVPNTPFQLFESWLNNAVECGLNSDPTAMTVATVDSQGHPSQRIVLLKGFDESGLRFFTNKQSHKGKDIALNPKVSCHFAWLALDRQVHFRGNAEPLSEQENDEYFYSRPFESQVAALISNQSQPIGSRDELVRYYQEQLEQYQGKQVPRPQHWGGYRIVPSEVEFWQGGEHRLHDRFIYRLESADNWSVQRLQP